MKRLICTFLAFGMLCSLIGCQETGMPRPDFPLEEEIVVAALEQTGLPGVISESETQSYAEGHISYTLREQTGTNGMMTAISSALTEGKRFLSIIFHSPSVPEPPPFSWEDWKKQLVFASLLSGGFADEEELYRAFSEQEVPESGETDKWIAERYEWAAALPAGYCIVRYHLINTKIESSSLGTRIFEQSPQMYITIYESESHYQKTQQKIMEREEAQENASAEAPS